MLFFSTFVSNCIFEIFKYLNESKIVYPYSLQIFYMIVCSNGRELKIEFLFRIYLEHIKFLFRIMLLNVRKIKAFNPRTHISEH